MIFFPETRETRSSQQPLHRSMSFQSRRFIKRIHLIIEWIKDWLVRRILGDPYSLTITLRRKKNYCRSLDLGNQVFNWVRVHTKHEFSTPLNILDMGCGDGRTAGAFARHNPQLHYVGLDVNAEWICKLNSKFKKTNYKFYHADVFNPYYNQQGQIKAENYKFPFDDQQFDLIILNSVFTHMPPIEVQNYLGEIQRTLRNQGLCWCTFYILKEDNAEMYQHAEFKFEFDMGNFKTINKTCPENAIAYNEETVKLIIPSGLQLTEVIYGWWRNLRFSHHDLNLHKQDVLILRKI